MVLPPATLYYQCTYPAPHVHAPSRCSRALVEQQQRKQHPRRPTPSKSFVFFLPKHAMDGGFLSLLFPSRSIRLVLRWNGSTKREAFRPNIRLSPMYRKKGWGRWIEREREILMSVDRSVDDDIQKQL